MKYILTIFALFSIKATYSQFSFINSPLVGNTIYNHFPDSNVFLTYFTSKSEIYYYELTQTKIDTISITNLPNVSTVFKIEGVCAISKNCFQIMIRESSGGIVKTFITINKGKDWKEFILPYGIWGNYSCHDQLSSKIYYSVKPNKIYIFDIAHESWDSIISNGLIFLNSLKNNEGIMTVGNLTIPYNSKYALTKDAGKSYRIINNINYNMIPYSSSNSGVLLNLDIVSSNFWLANYQYDSAGTTVEHLYLSKDTGVSWKICFDKTPSIIAPASNSVAYAYFVQNTTPTSYAIYQISETGDKICKLPFSKRIYTMRFFNSNNGLILTVDTPNQQPGIWRVTNGGGAPCSIAGINDKNIQSNLITLYPNPANNQITLANYSLQVHSNYHIYNLLGTLVQQGNLEEKETTININTLADGLYFIRVGDTTLKFVKGKD